MVQQSTVQPNWLTDLESKLADPEHLKAAAKAVSLVVPEGLTYRAEPNTYLNDVGDDLAAVLTLIGEAEDGGADDMALVGAVILNRLRDRHTRRHFGHKPRMVTRVVDVCFFKWAFSCWWSAFPRSRMFNVLLAKKGVQRRTRDQAVAAWWWARQMDPKDDPTQGATHYYATWMNQPPKWASSPKMVRTITHGKHVFFRELV